MNSSMRKTIHWDLSSHEKPFNQPAALTRSPRVSENISAQLQRTDYCLTQYLKILTSLSYQRRKLCHFKSSRKLQTYTNYHTTNKCTSCMSFIFKSLFKTLSLLLHVSIAYRLSSSGSTYSS